VSNEVRDRIEEVIEFWGGAEMVPNRDMAEFILAMPQMVKVKEFILANLNVKDRAAARYDTVALGERSGLDPETVAWALS
jgi:hypothetical protein